MAKFNAGESGKRKVGSKISVEKQIENMKKESSSTDKAEQAKAG